jgi:tripeptidyl-peptidase I
LYNIPKGSSKHKGNEIGIFEDGDWYDQEDLDLTFAAISPNIPKGTHPALEGIDGGVAPFFLYGYEEIGVESLLDMSLILPLVYPQQAILFQVDDLTALESSYGFGNTFLDALDASYCTFEGGDDPNLDPQYPDNWQAPGAPNGTGIVWPEKEMCGAYKPTNVISVSYGLGEDYFSFFYENRQCAEYLKLGLQGVTVVYASGDSGVSNRGSCIIPPDSEYNGDPGAFSPSFPASCPYLTAVGATQVRQTLQHFESRPSFFLRFVDQSR